MSKGANRKRVAPLLMVLAGLALLAVPVVAQTVIPGLPYTINAPGDYILDDNLTGMTGLVVKANHVTVDLNGFALIGAPGNGTNGIEVRGKLYDVEIRNGTVTAWALNGVLAEKTQNAQYDFLRVYANGLDGLRVGDASVVENVVAEHNNRTGIAAGNAVVVRESMSAGNLLYGVEIGEGGEVSELSIFQNGGGGVLAFTGTRVYGNAIKENGWTFAGGEECDGATYAGVTAQGHGVSFVDNVIVDNTIGILLMDPGNHIARNLVMGSMDNYDIVPGNLLEIMLAEVPEAIEWPAVVTLAGTLQGVAGSPGIHVTSNDVTIDLEGHCLQGVPGTLCGVFVDTPIENLVVRNGIIRDWGGCGVNADLAVNSRLEDLRLMGNDIVGARIGEGSTIMHTVATNNLFDGLKTMANGVIQSSTSNRNGNDGIQVGAHSLVVDSVASENSNYGINALIGVTVTGSTASNNRFGISAGEGASVSGCTTSFNDQIGIRVGGKSYVYDNTVFSQGTGVGIVTFSGPGTRIDSNTVTGNAVGLNILGEHNVVVRNLLTDNLTPYMLHPSTAHGEFMDVSAGGVILTDQPWVNYIMTP